MRTTKNYTEYKKAVNALIMVHEETDRAKAKELLDFSKKFSRNYSSNYMALVQDLSVIPVEKFKGENGKLSALKWIKELMNGDYDFPHAGQDRDALILTVKAFCASVPYVENHKRPLTRAEKFEPTVTRSSLVRSQTSTDGVEYSVGVPFVPYFYKKYHNVPYSDWDFKDPAFPKIIGAQLAEILDYLDEPSNALYINNFTVEDLQEFHEITQYVNGQDHTVKRCPNSVEGGSDFNEIPKLLRLMLLQKWMFNPETSKNKYVIRNPFDWDSQESLYKIKESRIPQVNTSEDQYPW